MIIDLISLRYLKIIMKCFRSDLRRIINIFKCKF